MKSYQYKVTVISSVIVWEDTPEAAEKAAEKATGKATGSRTTAIYADRVMIAHTFDKFEGARNIDIDIRRANARLIAQAPAMLKALEALQNWWLNTTPKDREEAVTMPGKVFDLMNFSIAQAKAKKPKGGPT